MKKNKNTVKMFLAGTAAVILCTGAFTGANYLAMGMALNQSEDVHTVYPTIPVTAASDEEREIIPVEVVLSEYSHTPAEGALSAEEAVQAGARHYKALFDMDVSGKTFRAMYSTTLAGKPFWQCVSVLEDPNEFDSDQLVFNIYALTGEVFSIERFVPGTQETKAFVVHGETEKEWYAKSGPYQEKAKALAAVFFEAEIANVTLFNVSWNIRHNPMVYEFERAIEDGDEYEVDSILLNMQVTDIYGRQCDFIFQAETMVLTGIYMIDPTASEAGGLG